MSEKSRIGKYRRINEAVMAMDDYGEFDPGNEEQMSKYDDYNEYSKLDDTQKMHFFRANKERQARRYRGNYKGAVSTAAYRKAVAGDNGTRYEDDDQVIYNQNTGKDDAPGQNYYILGKLNNKAYKECWWNGSEFTVGTLEGNVSHRNEARYSYEEIMAEYKKALLWVQENNTDDINDMENVIAVQIAQFRF